MKNFAKLFEEVSGSTKTTDKLNYLIEYFSKASEEDKIWALALFTGRRPKRAVSSTKLHEWAAGLANIPLWLFEESYGHVGDLSETIALILPDNETGSDKSLSYWVNYLIDLHDKTEEEKKAAITKAWLQLNKLERFVFNKLMSSTFRIGVSQAVMVNAISKLYDVPSQVMMHRISGKWEPGKISFHDLVQGDHADTDASKPYPFYLAYPLEEEPQTLGSVDDWQLEWKWDGMRGQIIKRKGELYTWSRGEELVTEKFPEYEVLKNILHDGTVLDGEIICYAAGRPLPFSLLQTRIGRKNLSKKVLQDAPAAFIAYDILEYNGEDIRGNSQGSRRELLEEVVNEAKEIFLKQTLMPGEKGKQDEFPLLLSPLINVNTWDELIVTRNRSRDEASEGIMLKKKNSTYQAGRKRGDWWKWKVDPLSIDCILVAAQKGSGRRASLYTDYTFAVPDAEGKLITFAKAYSGLTDKEFAEVDAFIKRNILEKFGPVRTVKPQLVFELGFEGIAASTRHKSGVAVRFPRMLRWRKDKPVQEANTLADLQALLKIYGHSKPADE